MISRTTERFRKAFAKLPISVQQQARQAYRTFKRDPYHPSLRFKQVHATKPIYSARINRDYRVVGVRNDEAILWFWIGPHDDYEQLLKRL